MQTPAEFVATCNCVLVCVCGPLCGCFCECICLCVASLCTDCKQLIQNFNCQCWNYALRQRTSGSQTSTKWVWENPEKTDLP